MYRGTEVIIDMHLETSTTEAVADFPVKEVDLSDIKVNIIEELRFARWVFDVSGRLKVADYGYIDEDTFYVDLATDYAVVDYWDKLDPVRITIKNAAALSTTSTNTTSATTKQETTTSTTVSETASTVTTSASPAGVKINNLSIDGEIIKGSIL